jgi:hypothetical protein
MRCGAAASCETPLVVIGKKANFFSKPRKVP